MHVSLLLLLIFSVAASACTEVAHNTAATTNHAQPQLVAAKENPQAAPPAGAHFIPLDRTKLHVNRKQPRPPSPPIIPGHALHIAPVMPQRRAPLTDQPPAPASTP